MTDYKLGESIEVSIDRLAYGGNGVARPKGRAVVFVERSAPGDLVRAEIMHVKKRHAEARILSILEPGPNRRDPACQSYDVCGGCQLQHMEIESQREAKAQQVLDALKRIAGRSDIRIAAVHTGEEFHYRNKVVWHWSERLRDFGLVGRFGTVTTIPDCWLLGGPLMELSRDARTQAAKVFPAVTPRTLMVRVNQAGQGQVCLEVASNLDHDVLASFALSLPEVSVWITSSGRDQHLTGPRTITMRFGSFETKVLPAAFAQVNTRMATEMYELVAAEADVQSMETVADLYSGAGAIALRLARSAERVIAIEKVEAAIDRLRENALREGIENIESICSDIHDAGLHQLTPDVVVLDPPRAGAGREVMQWMERAGPRRVVYVSCNPTTFARDLSELPSYRLEKLQVVDMFPQTHHIETIATLDHI